MCRDIGSAGKKPAIIVSFSCQWIFRSARTSYRAFVRPVPSTRPATIFPQYIDELKHCCQASGTPKTVYFLKVHDVSYPNSDENTNTKTKTKTNTFRERLQGAILGTCDLSHEILELSDEETGPDQKTDNDKDKYKIYLESKYKYKDKDNDKDKYIESTFKERS